MRIYEPGRGLPLAEFIEAIRPLPFEVVCAFDPATGDQLFPPVMGEANRALLPDGVDLNGSVVVHNHTAVSPVSTRDLVSSVSRRISRLLIAWPTGETIDILIPQPFTADAMSIDAWRTEARQGATREFDRLERFAEDLEALDEAVNRLIQVFIGIRFGQEGVIMRIEDQVGALFRQFGDAG
jgi:hypothetical protein